jgi:hypothetical protein
MVVGIAVVTCGGDVTFWFRLIVNPSRRQVNTTTLHANQDAAKIAFLRISKQASSRSFCYCESLCILTDQRPPHWH